jgi:hypothetical protein
LPVNRKNCANSSPGMMLISIVFPVNVEIGFKIENEKLKFGIIYVQIACKIHFVKNMRV